MIARLRGEVIEKGTQSITIDVQGVGYTIAVADDRIYLLQQAVDLHIYYHWNQEQGPVLYGFSDALAKAVFIATISCSGIGPKIGLAMLAQLTPQALLQAIMTANVDALSSVHGVGSKKAELMIMQLKDKVTKIAASHGMHEHATHGKGAIKDTLVKVKTVHEALAALRYKPSEITAALDFLQSHHSLEAYPVEELLRQGLSFLAKRV